MSSKDHKSELDKTKFCAFRPGRDMNYTCECPQKYPDNCDPKENWDKELNNKFRFRRVQTRRDTGHRYYKDIGHNAHHLLPEEKVVQVLWAETGIRGIVRSTKWCINAKPNIYPQPLWGHTFKYYTTMQQKSFFDPKRGYFKPLTSARCDAPPFENYPMHNYDHHKFNEDVEKRLNRIKNNVRTSKKKHKDKTKQLKDALKRLSRALRKDLTNRGTNRQGGTHKAWFKGREKPDSKWYEPFSMAANPTPKHFVKDILHDKVVARAAKYYM